MTIVLPIFLGDFPAESRVFLTFSEAFFLFLLADMQPEFHDHHTIVGQLSLELIYLIVGLPPFLFLAQLVYPLNQNTAGPRAVEDPHAPGRWQLEPETPEERSEKLILKGRGDRMKMCPAWVQPLGEIIDAIPFAGGIPSLKDDHNGQFCFQGLSLELPEFLPQVEYKFFICLLVE